MLFSMMQNQGYVAAAGDRAGMIISLGPKSLPEPPKISTNLGCGAGAEDGAAGTSYLERGPFKFSGSASLCKTVHNAKTFIVCSDSDEISLEPKAVRI